MKKSRIGRRTGKPIVKKSVRTEYDGTEKFDDYWTDSSAASRTADESTFIKKNRRLNASSAKSFKVSNSSSLKRSLSSTSGISEDVTSPNVASNSLDLTNIIPTNSRKHRMTQRDISLQTSQVYNTPVTKEIDPKHFTSLRKRISFNATVRFGTTRSTKRQSKNRSFGGEKTWLDKSSNTLNLGRVERSVQTSNRKRLRQVQAKTHFANTTKERTHSLSGENDTHDSHRVLKDRSITMNGNSPLGSSFAAQKRENKNGSFTGGKTRKTIESENLNRKTHLEGSTLTTEKRSDNGDAQQSMNRSIYSNRAIIENSKSETILVSAEGSSKQEKLAVNTSLPSTSKNHINSETVKDSVPVKRGRKRKKRAENQHELNIQPEEETHEGRRPKRNRIAPLAFWRNERRIFKFKEFGDVTCVGIEKGSQEDHKPLAIEKKLKKSREPDPPNQRESLEALNKIGACYKAFDEIKWSKTFLQKDGKEAYIISKTYSDQSSSVGYLEVFPGCRKEEQYSPTYNICFTVIMGQVVVSLNNTDCNLKTKDFLRVPIGVPYSIHNPGKRKALIHFITSKPQQED